MTPSRPAQIVLATLGLYGSIIGIAILKSKLTKKEAPPPEFPDYHTGPLIIFVTSASARVNAISCFIV